MKIPNKQLFIWFFLISVGFATQPKVHATYANQNTFLRYANDNLGGLSNLNAFNVTRIAQSGSSLATVGANASKGLILTTGTGQATGVFLKEQMAADIASPGFSTYFVMNIYRLNTDLPADGYVFVVAADANSLGSAGGGLGYQGINNSLGVEFDFYDNGNSSIRENVPAADVFKNGALPLTAGVNFDSNFKTQRWDDGNYNLKRAFHTWIEYDATNTRLELRVVPSDYENPATNRPARPVQPLLSRTIALPEISQYFYTGFTAATGGQAQQMALKSWFFSNAYIPGGINPGQVTYVVDNQPPTPPTISGRSIGNQYEITISGGSDAESAISGYQYKALNGNWTNYTGPTLFSANGVYQARSVDTAGNFSSAISATLYDIHFSVNQNIIHTVKRLSNDSDFEVTYSYQDNAYLVTSWYLNSDLSGEPVVLIPARNTSITLFGEPIQFLFEIDYVLAGGTFESSPPNHFRIDEALILPQLLKEGYEFVGWYLDDAFSLPFISNQTPLPSQNLVLFASWVIKSYELRIHNALTIESVIQLPTAFSTSIDDILETIQLEKVGHTFAGWYLDPHYETPYLVESTMPAQSLDLYAKWSVKQYQIQFYLDDETIWFEQVQNYGDTIQLPNNPSWYGYEFQGWTFQNTVMVDGATVLDSDMVLVAQWSLLSFDLNIQLNNGDIIHSGNFNYLTPLLDVLPEEVLKEGHQFLGWYLDEDFQVPVSETTLIESNTQVFARWQIKTYSLKLYTSSDGSPLEMVEVTYGEKPNLPVDLSRDGYLFGGWKDTQGNLIDDGWVMPSYPVEIFAVWMGLSGQVTFIYGSEVVVLTFTSGELVGGLPDLPIKPGYVFVGWTTVPHDINFLVSEAEIVANGQTLVLYPIWEKIDLSEATMQNSIRLDTGFSTDYRFSLVIMLIVTGITALGIIYYLMKRADYAHH
jgi:uncharacterized repeat protein (TIGR02543 family)